MKDIQGSTVLLGQLRMLMTHSYFDTDQSVPVLTDPLAADSSAMGSAARPRDCAKEVLGP